MVTLRFTRKLLDFMGFDPITKPEPPTALLGDWYANLVDTERGDLIVFVNERTLLSVAVEEKNFREIIPTFIDRVNRLMYEFQLPQAQIERELQEIGDIQIALVKNQRVTGFMNQITKRYQAFLAKLPKKKSGNVGILEYELCTDRYKVLGGLRPIEVARNLLSGEEIGICH